MDTTPTRHSPKAVLMLGQRLAGPTLNQHWVSVQFLLGKPPVNTCVGIGFEFPAVRGGRLNTRGGGGSGFFLHQIIVFLPTPSSKTNNFFPEMSQTNIFFQDIFIDPFNCEAGMHGTVTCRPTEAYRVQADCINISN